MDGSSLSASYKEAEAGLRWSSLDLQDASLKRRGADARDRKIKRRIDKLVADLNALVSLHAEKLDRNDRQAAEETRFAIIGVLEELINAYKLAVEFKRFLIDGTQRNLDRAEKIKNLEQSLSEDKDLDLAEPARLLQGKVQEESILKNEVAELERALSNKKVQLKNVQMAITMNRNTVEARSAKRSRLTGYIEDQKRSLFDDSANKADEIRLWESSKEAYSQSASDLLSAVDEIEAGLKGWQNSLDSVFALEDIAYSGHNPQELVEKLHDAALYLTHIKDRLGNGSPSQVIYRALGSEISHLTALASRFQKPDHPYKLCGE